MRADSHILEKRHTLSFKPKADWKREDGIFKEEQAEQQGGDKAEQGGEGLRKKKKTELKKKTEMVFLWLLMNRQYFKSCSLRVCFHGDV